MANESCLVASYWVGHEPLYQYYVKEIKHNPQTIHLELFKLPYFQVLLLPRRWLCSQCYLPTNWWTVLPVTSKAGVSESTKHDGDQGIDFRWFFDCHRWQGETPSLLQIQRWISMVWRNSILLLLPKSLSLVSISFSLQLYKIPLYVLLSWENAFGQTNANEIMKLWAFYFHCCFIHSTLLQEDIR